MVAFFNMEDLLFLARPGFAERSEWGVGVLTNGMGLSTYLPGGKTGSRLAQQGTRPAALNHWGQTRSVCGMAW